MLLTCVPLTDFVHGTITAHEGRPQMLEAGVAADLERAGLVRIKLSDTRPQSVKTQDDGRGQPSSALLQAPVSPTKTLQASKPGEGKRPKSGT